MTPMLQQYFSLKKKCTDAILFFRMGDFYEVFGEDAVLVAPLLNIVLTSRNKEEKVPFCGVPHHSYRNYCLKLIKLGYKVAVAEQIKSETSGKNILRREIVKIITPGLQDDLEILEKDKANYFACLYEEPAERRWALLLADVSTGELRLGEFTARHEALALLKNSEPKEIAARVFQHQQLRSEFGSPCPLFSALPEEYINDKMGRERALQACFPAQILEEVRSTSMRTCLAAFIGYLRQHYLSPDNFLRIMPLTGKQEMALAENVVRDLELFSTVHKHSTQGSLFRVINNTCTPMGARLLAIVCSIRCLTSKRCRKEKQKLLRILSKG